MRKRAPYYIAILILCFVRCAGSESNVANQIKMAGEIILSAPDSALLILSGIDERDIKSTKLRANYNLLLTMGHDKNAIPHTSPDRMLMVKKYYINKGSDKLLSNIYYYLGRTYEDTGQKEESLKSYLKASKFSKATNQNQLNGLISSHLADLYHKDYDLEYAQMYIDDAVANFKECGDSINLARTYDLKARNLLLLEDYDSATSLYIKAEKIYESFRDTSALISNRQSQAAIYFYHLENPDSAAKILVETYERFTNNEVPLLHYLLLSQIETERGHSQKSIDLLNKYLTINTDIDVDVLSSVHYLLSEAEYSLSHFDAAYEHLEEYAFLQDSINEIEKANLLRVAEKRYEKLELENEYTTYKQKTTYNVILYSLLGLILLVALVYISINRKKKIDRLEADLVGLQSQMSDFEDVKNKLSAKLSKADAKEARLQEVLYNKIQHIQKIVDNLYVYENNPEEFKKRVKTAIIFAEKDQYFGELHEVVNQKCYGIVDYLKKEFPTLSNDDLNLCCLICFGFNNNQISILFGHTNSNSIFNKRHKLRKKLGLWPTYESLEAYLEDIISKLKKERIHTT